ncbi:MAG: BatA domain-containing protein [Verrucomicrobiae bacterium]|nr:BatA domain-containing protein [Verrucomicrobiae bacterium]
MSFLEPIMLYGLPLALLPVLIHLLNKLRHRTIKWAAMMFLLSANRTATRQARIKQWLILLMRVLAVAAIILVISRPIAGGWMGKMFRGAPEAAIMILDRSLSMETRINGITKRELALKLLIENARPLLGKSRLILLDSTTGQPQEIAEPDALPRLSSTSGTDTYTDIPSILQKAIEWIKQNKIGSAEIWIASDMQKSNWQSESDRWRSIQAALSSISGDVRIKLLSVKTAGNFENNSIRINECSLKKIAGNSFIELEINIERTSPDQINLPANITLNNNRQYIEIPCQGQTVRYRHKIPVEEKYEAGWGKIEIPADSNLRDNVVYFVYSPPPPIKVAVVSSNNISAKLLAIAAAPSKTDTNRVSELLPMEKFATINPDDYALIIWNDKIPEGPVVENLHNYLNAGGAVLMFAASSTGNFEGISFGETQEAPTDKFWKITKWHETDGPLARTEEGFSMPLNELQIYKRQILNGQGSAIAFFEDDSTFIRRKNFGKGQILLVGTSPEPSWSNLGDGIVLVPLTHRLIAFGGKRVSQAGMLSCGENLPLKNIEQVLPVEGKDYRTQGGVYKIGGKLFAFNHPEEEDNFEVIDGDEARALFGKTPVILFEEKRAEIPNIQSELWRLFLFGVIFFLLAESILILPLEEGIKKTTEKT